MKSPTASPAATATLAVAAAIALIVGACSDNSDNAGSTESAGTDSATSEVVASTTSTTMLEAGPLQWEQCSTPERTEAGLECATVEVLIDRADPQAGTIDLALARLPATGEPDERIGSMLMNPGGPGQPGIDFVASFGAEMPGEVRSRFDLVSWDVRGAGESTAVRCLDDATRNESMTDDLSPDTEAEELQAIEDQREFVSACVDNNPELVRHMSTADSATDMEAIRRALGEEQVTYLGISYGTALGATYATMFPSHTRAMVLDAAMSPEQTAYELFDGQLTGVERVYGRFVAACDSDPTCALAGRTDEAISALRDQLDAEPMVIASEGGDRLLTKSLFDLGLLSALYNPDTWTNVANVIAEMGNGGPGDWMLLLADDLLGRNPDGTWDNSRDVSAMVLCADFPEKYGVEEAKAVGERMVSDAPVFGELYRLDLLGCLDWPDPANPVPGWTAEGAPPILVVGTEGDPATPYEWSEQMADALEGARLLTYEGDGHAAFTRSGPCIDDAVTAYLVDLELPTDGTSCPVAGDSAA